MKSILFCIYIFICTTTFKSMEYYQLIIKSSADLRFIWTFVNTTFSFILFTETFDETPLQSLNPPPVKPRISILQKLGDTGIKRSRQPSPVFENESDDSDTEEGKNLRDKVFSLCLRNGKIIFKKSTIGIDVLFEYLQPVCRFFFRRLCNYSINLHERYHQI